MRLIDKDNLQFIGITGTNGKTTTAFLIHHLLKKLGQPVALLSTIEYIIGSEVIAATYTTPPNFLLDQLIKKIKKAKCRYAVMEVSSHGLCQDRVKGIKFWRCVFTNLTKEHLDYHKTMRCYFEAKRKLFTNNKEALSFVNIDDGYGRKLLKMLKNKRSYGIDRAGDLRARQVSLSDKGSDFNLILSGKSYKVSTKLLGKYNILNVLAAVGVVHSLGFSIEKILRHVGTFKGAEGRLQKVSSNIFIDYAHTPDALENTLKALHKIGYRKIVAVFGCGGDRDSLKRKPMGRIAGKMAEFTFITSDNSRSEDPNRICRQISRGFAKNNYSIITDREQAISKAIDYFYGKIKTKEFSKKSCIVIAGKGHEQYQVIGSRRLPFKDKFVVKKILRGKEC